jgi:hypothetical protein
MLNSNKSKNENQSIIGVNLRAGAIHQRICTSIRCGKDSIYIQQIEDSDKPFKVLHAEPLFIDLIRDLGARKGERKWNVGFGLTDNLKFDTH